MAKLESVHDINHRGMSRVSKGRRMQIKRHSVPSTVLESRPPAARHGWMKARATRGVVINHGQPNVLGVAWRAAETDVRHCGQGHGRRCLSSYDSVPGARMGRIGADGARPAVGCWRSRRTDQQGPFGRMKRVCVHVVIPVCFRVAARDLGQVPSAGFAELRKQPGWVMLAGLGHETGRIGRCRPACRDKSMAARTGDRTSLVLAPRTR